MYVSASAPWAAAVPRLHVRTNADAYGERVNRIKMYLSVCRLICACVLLPDVICDCAYVCALVCVCVVVRVRFRGCRDVKTNRVEAVALSEWYGRRE